MRQTATEGTTTPVTSTVTVLDRPATEQLQAWWEAMHRDDLSIAYADSFPPTLADFRREVAQGEKILLLGLVDGEVAGALWLHDLQHHRDGTVYAGWFGAYFLPAYRGCLTVRLWQAALQYWEAAGIVHFFSAIHVANRRSQACLTRGMHFHRVGKFPAFTLYHGQPTDLFIYTLRAEDAALAWELASARAARQMLGIAS